MGVECAFEVKGEKFMKAAFSTILNILGMNCMFVTCGTTYMKIVKKSSSLILNGNKFKLFKERFSLIFLL